MPGAGRQYAAVVVLFALAAFVHGDLMWRATELLLHADQLPASTGTVAVASRTISTGPLAGDQILAINGRPYNAAKDGTEIVKSSRPGDPIRFTLSEPGGRAIERDFTVPSARSNFFSQFAIVLALQLLVPLMALTLGFGVVMIRPADRNAWLVLCMMLGFAATVYPPLWEGIFPDFRIVWGGIWNTAWPIALMLFGIYFPERSLRDQRLPWLKWIFIVLFAAAGLGVWSIFLIWQHDINASEKLRSAYGWFRYLQTMSWVIATLGFFANFRRKSAAETSADGRRRLSILRAGSMVGLGPVGTLVLASLFSRGELFEHIPVALTVTALLLMPFFPLTLVYVIVVERAMDLQFAIRSGVKYTLARFGLWAVRAAMLSLAAYVFIVAWRRGITSWQPFELAGAAGVLVMMRKPVAERASQWVDRKFFREAYDAERVLAGLASEVGEYLEARPLLERVAVRVGETLHVAEIVILLREGDVFRAAYTTRPGEPMDIAADGGLVAQLKRGEPEEIYFDTPPLWIRSLSAQELQTLDFMRTQLLLPIMGREGLSGIISLGPKLSEAAYSETDKRLLQAVAWQTGMALENGRLLASLAQEAAHRERLSYELEIAREVQERLYPQSYPPVPGVEYRGYCRPAQGIGGDYYDFLQLGGGKLGIAIGDVSGKGIAAALVMASLQASLRSQAISGTDSLATLMANLNRLVFDASTSSRYATFFYAAFDPETRELRYVNAGHNPPFILRGGEVIRLETGGPVIGLLKGARYEQGSCSLAPGDILILFTDGVSEAMTGGDEEWGEERLVASAREHAGLHPAQMIEAIFQDADAHTGSAPQYDDMTLIAIKLTR